MTRDEAEYYMYDAFYTVLGLDEEDIGEFDELENHLGADEFAVEEVIEIIEHEANMKIDREGLEDLATFDEFVNYIASH